MLSGQNSNHCLETTMNKPLEQGYQNVTETEKSDLSPYASPLLRHSEIQILGSKGIKSVIFLGYCEAIF